MHNFFVQVFTVIVFLCLFTINLSYAAISHNVTDIEVSGTETGDSLRSYVTTNGIGTVSGRTLILGRDLRIQTGANFTDNNSNYTFPGIYRYEPLSGATVNFTDVVIRYEGSPKNHSFNNAYTANYTRVTYINGVTSGRSDFFNNGDYTFNFSDVSIISYGASDYLHFQTSETLSNITITNANGGLNFEPGARNDGEVMVVKNLKLSGVTNMVGGSGANGDFRSEDMSRSATSWNHSPRNVDFIYVNPIKPSGWTGYNGDGSKVSEYYTHDVQVVKEANTPVEGSIVKLFQSDGTTIVYDELSDPSGQITTQEVLTYNGGVFFENFEFRVAHYLQELRSGIRALQDKQINESVLTPTDLLITEQSSSTVDSYTTIDSPFEFYDRAKSYLINNYNGETQTIVGRLGNNLDAKSYNVIIDGSATQAFAFDGTTITIKSTNFTGDITTTGTITLQNGGSVNGILNDGTGISSVLQLTNIPASSSVYIMNDVGVTHLYNGSVTGNTTTNIPSTATGEWTYVVKKPGFNPQVGKFTPVGERYSYPITLSTVYQTNGVTMYTGGTSSIIDIEYTGTSQMSIDIADGTVTNQKIYDSVEDSFMSEAGMKWIANGLNGVTISNLTSGSFLFLTDNIRIRRNTAGDSNATVDSFVVSTQGIFLDSSNGAVQILVSTAQNVTLLPSEKEDIATRVKTKMEESNSLLDRIYKFFYEILTRVVSIKSDSQKIN